MTTEEPRLVSIKVAEAEPILEGWTQLPEDARGPLQVLATQLRDSVLSAGMTTAKTAQEIWDDVIEPVVDQIPPVAAEWLTLTRKHAWEDRTWAQRLILLSLIPTLPVTGGKAAGLAMLGTAFRVGIPVVGAAAGALVGSGLDLVSSTAHSFTVRSTEATSDHETHLTFDPELHRGIPCINGIPIRDILGYLAQGWSRETILNAHSNLDDADITAALQFASGAMNCPINL